MADRKISDLTALTTPASGDYLPIVDISEVAAASKNKRITIEELMRGAPDGTAAAPSIAFESDPNTGIYSPGADQVAISTNGTGRLFVNSSGSVGVGTTSPTVTLDVFLPDSNPAEIRVRNDNDGILQLYTGSASSVIGTVGATPLVFRTNATERLRITSAGLLGLGTSSPTRTLDVAGGIHVGTGTNDAVIGYNEFTAGVFGIGTASTVPLVFGTTSLERVRIDTSGNVGIGTTSPGYALDVVGTVNSNALFRASNGTHIALLGSEAFSAGVVGVGSGSNHPLVFGTNSIERARIDSSGRLLVGTSTARSAATQTWGAQFEGTTYSNSGLSLTVNRNDNDATYLVFGKSRGTTIGSNTIVQSGDNLGGIFFAGANGSTLNDYAASIRCEVDGTPGVGDMPGRLVFSTTADGAASPTERMRINNAGTTAIYSTGDPVLGVNSSRAAGSTDTIYGGYHSATSTTSGTQSFRVFTNGNVENTNNSYGAISDLKLKENIVDANSQWDDIKALQVRKYNFKEETGQQTHVQIGLVAQEVELVSPGLVSESPDRDAEGNDLGTVTKSVNYSVLYMKAVKALQEAMERIETLEAKVAALEAS